MMGEPRLPGALTLNVSVRQSPMAAPTPVSPAAGVVVPSKGPVMSKV